MARQQYYTNFRFMWSDNTIVNKLLARPLKFLLLIHLSPWQYHSIKLKRAERESTKPQQMSKGKQRATTCTNSEAEISVLNKTRDRRRKLFSDEMK
ncbi:hypothetical protein [Parasitella parasitica]|uniref:Uncharacterized protein n=1 Tax=Parasitella parasitica TaxID=35722 RepID=A0A0B7NAK4_9FUNG|nr:hypothetical protein [Parasitella parasitica]